MATRSVGARRCTAATAPGEPARQVKGSGAPPPTAGCQSRTKLGSAGYRSPPSVTEKSPFGTGMGVVVVRDVPHVVVDVVAYRELLGRDPCELVVHVCERIGRRRRPVLPPHDHRDVADLAVGDPADVVLVVPWRDVCCLAQFAARDSFVVRHVASHLGKWKGAPPLRRLLGYFRRRPRAADLSRRPCRGTSFDEACHASNGATAPVLGGPGGVGPVGARPAQDTISLVCITGEMLV